MEHGTQGTHGNRTWRPDDKTKSRNYKYNTKQKNNSKKQNLEHAILNKPKTLGHRLSAMTEILHRHSAEKKYNTSASGVILSFFRLVKESEEHQVNTHKKPRTHTYTAAPPAESRRVCWLEIRFPLMSWFLLFLSQIASCSSPLNILTSLPAHTVLSDQ